MSALEQWLMELLLTHHVGMLRAEAEAKARVMATLVLMQRDIVSLLANSPEISALGKAGKNALLRESNDVISKYYGKAQQELDLAGVAEVEAMGVQSALAKVVDLRPSAELPSQPELKAAIAELRGEASAEAVATSIEIRLGVALPTENYLRTLASDALIQGSPAKNWWLRQAQDTQFKLANEIRIGAAQSETNAQIIKRVVGQEVTAKAAPEFVGPPGIMPLARRNAAAVVQTSMATVAAEARRKTMEVNRDIANGIMQISTLDSHTSLTCIAYSGAQWNLDYEPINGNDLPYNGGVPRHFNAVAGGEMVLTATGPKPIERVAVGELVATHRGRLRPVTAVMCKRNDTGIIRIVRLESGRTIRVTDEHPVLAADRGWIRADMLKTGDKLFQHQDKPMLIGVRLRVDERQPEDYPSLFDAGEIFSKVAIEPGVVAASIKLDDDLAGKDREIPHAVPDDELALVRDSMEIKPIAKQNLSERKIRKLGTLNILENALHRTAKGCRVVFRHAFRVIRVVGVSVFGEAPGPMVFSGHLSRALGFGHSDAGRNSALANGNSVTTTPAIENGFTDPLLALDLTNRLGFPKVLRGDQISDYIPVSKVNHFASEGVIDIRTVAHNGLVYNLAVEDDETYLVDGVVVHNCRSSEIPLMKTLREMGIDMDEPDPGMRASSSGPISAKTTFADYLKMKGEDYQNEVLGKGRAALFREGKLTPRDLVNMDGRPLKLSDLKAKYAQ